MHKSPLLDQVPHNDSVYGCLETRQVEVQLRQFQLSAGDGHGAVQAVLLFAAQTFAVLQHNQSIATPQDHAFRFVQGRLCRRSGRPQTTHAVQIPLMQFHLVSRQDNQVRHILHLDGLFLEIVGRLFDQCREPLDFELIAFAIDRNQVRAACNVPARAAGLCLRLNPPRHFRGHFDLTIGHRQSVHRDGQWIAIDLDRPRIHHRSLLDFSSFPPRLAVSCGEHEEPGDTGPQNQQGGDQLQHETHQHESLYDGRFCRDSERWETQSSST